MYLGELDLIDDVLVRVPLFLSSSVLGHLFDLDLAILTDNLLNVEL